MKKIFRNSKATIISHPKYKALSQRLAALTLPGFEGVPVSEVLQVFISEVKQDKLGPRASAVAFNFLLALFPSIIFLFSLIPLIPIDGLQEEIFELLQRVMPESAFEVAHFTIEDIVNKKRVDLLSLGFLATMFFSINGVVSMMRSFSKFNPVFRQRSFIAQFGVAMKLMTLLFTLLLFSIFLIFGGEWLISELRESLGWESDVSYLLFSSLRWLIIIFVFFFTLSIIYYYGPALKNRWRFISLGATVATILSILASLGFSYYVNNFGHYNKFYGSIGTLIVIMVWLWINSMVLLFGFELNNSIILSKYKKAQEEGD